MSINLIRTLFDQIICASLEGVHHHRWLFPNTTIYTASLFLFCDSFRFVPWSIAFYIIVNTLFYYPSYFFKKQDFYLKVQHQWLTSPNLIWMFCVYWLFPSYKDDYFSSNDFIWSWSTSSSKLQPWNSFSPQKWIRF